MSELIVAHHIGKLGELSVSFSEQLVVLLDGGLVPHMQLQSPLERIVVEVGDAIHLVGLASANGSHCRTGLLYCLDISQHLSQLGRILCLVWVHYIVRCPCHVEQHWPRHELLLEEPVFLDGLSVCSVSLLLYFIINEPGRRSVSYPDLRVSLGVHAFVIKHFSCMIDLIRACEHLLSVKKVGNLFGVVGPFVLVEVGPTVWHTVLARSGTSCVVEALFSVKDGVISVQIRGMLVCIIRPSSSTLYACVVLITDGPAHVSKFR